MYVTYKPEDHDKWRQRKDAYRKGAATGKQSKPDAADSKQT